MTTCIVMLYKENTSQLSWKCNRGCRSETSMGSSCSRCFPFAHACQTCTIFGCRKTARRVCCLATNSPAMSTKQHFPHTASAGCATWVLSCRRHPRLTCLQTASGIPPAIVTVQYAGGYPPQPAHYVVAAGSSTSPGGSLIFLRCIWTGSGSEMRLFRGCQHLCSKNKLCKECLRGMFANNSQDPAATRWCCSLLLLLPTG